MRPQIYEKLSREYQEERLRVELALKAIQQENREYIADLDAALDVIAEIGTRYVQQSEQRQRAILRHVVGKVVIDPEGTIIRLELQPPFTYLRDLAADETGGKRSRHLHRLPPYPVHRHRLYPPQRLQPANRRASMIPFACLNPTTSSSGGKAL